MLISDSRTARAARVMCGLLIAVDALAFFYLLFFGGWSSTPVSSLPALYWALLVGVILTVLLLALGMPMIRPIAPSSANYKNLTVSPAQALLFGGLFFAGVFFPDARADGSYVYRFFIGLTFLLCGAWNLRQARKKIVPK